MTLIRKADLENHNKDGGQWIVIGGQVYDIEDFRSASMADSEDITKLLEATASQGKYYKSIVNNFIFIYSLNLLFVFFSFFFPRIFRSKLCCLRNIYFMELRIVILS